MRGYVLVLDTNRFTKTDPAGQFRLDGVPAGRYRLKVWVDPKQTLERPVEIHEGEVLRVDLTGTAP